MTQPVQRGDRRTAGEILMLVLMSMALITLVAFTVSVAAGVAV